MRDAELIQNPDFSITIGRASFQERIDGGTAIYASSSCIIYVKLLSHIFFGRIVIHLSILF